MPQKINYTTYKFFKLKIDHFWASMKEAQKLPLCLNKSKKLKKKKTNPEKINDFSQIYKRNEVTG